MDDGFQTAYLRARQRVGAEAWRLLSNVEKERAVAEQLRELEKEQSEQPDDRPERSTKQASLRF